jgi:hypothetical protein
VASSGPRVDARNVFLYVVESKPKAGETKKAIIPFVKDDGRTAVKATRSPYTLHLKTSKKSSSELSVGQRKAFLLSVETT